MLTAADNELLCRVSPGTPMGTLMRQYWMPALQPSELPEPDGAPLRLRLLGEDLVAWRNTDGSVGLMQNACPHRGASMFFGRNEENGLRCVYHGWKFDTEGTCTDMPNEPAESNFKHKIHATAYPCIERNGIIWAYMGPRQTPPPLPELLANLVEGCQVTQYQRECNWMQALEGDIDTLHWGFLHAGHLPNEKTIPGTPDYYATRHRNARMEVVEHRVGTSYGAYRPAGEDTDYWRMANFMLPFYTQNPTQLLGRKSMGNAWVPLDDEHCMVWQFVDPTPSGEDVGIGGLKQGRFRNDPPKPELAGFLPHTTDGLGRWRAKQNARNDYGIDREWQKQNLLYSGMANGAAAQDTAMQESMGPIYDRTKEHLGTTDGMIIRTRAKLLSAARALRDSGAIPAGVDEPALYRMRSGGAVVPRGLSGLEVCKDVLFDRALTVDLPVR